MRLLMLFGQVADKLPADLITKARHICQAMIKFILLFGQSSHRVTCSTNTPQIKRFSAFRDHITDCP